MGNVPCFTNALSSVWRMLLISKTFRQESAALGIRPSDIMHRYDSSDTVPFWSAEVRSDHVFLSNGSAITALNSELKPEKIFWKVHDKGEIWKFVPSETKEELFACEGENLYELVRQCSWVRPGAKPSELRIPKSFTSRKSNEDLVPGTNIIALTLTDRQTVALVYRNRTLLENVVYQEWDMSSQKTQYAPIRTWSSRDLLDGSSSFQPEATAGETARILTSFVYEGKVFMVATVFHPNLASTIVFTLSDVGNSSVAGKVVPVRCAAKSGISSNGTAAAVIQSSSTTGRGPMLAVTFSSRACSRRSRDCSLVCAYNMAGFRQASVLQTNAMGMYTYETAEILPTKVDLDDALLVSVTSSGWPRIMLIHFDWNLQTARIGRNLGLQNLHKLNDLKLSSDNQYFYLINSTTVGKLEMNPCAKRQTCSACLEQQETTDDCGWCIFQNRCSYQPLCYGASDSGPGKTVWLRDYISNVSECPVTESLTEKSDSNRTKVLFRIATENVAVPEEIESRMSCQYRSHGFSPVFEKAVFSGSSNNTVEFACPQTSPQFAVSVAELTSRAATENISAVTEIVLGFSHADKFFPLHVHVHHADLDCNASVAGCLVVSARKPGARTWDLWDLISTGTVATLLFGMLCGGALLMHMRRKISAYGHLSAVPPRTWSGPPAGIPQQAQFARRGSRTTWQRLAVPDRRESNDSGIALLRQSVSEGSAPDEFEFNALSPSALDQELLYYQHVYEQVPESLSAPARRADI